MKLPPPQPRTCAICGGTGSVWTFTVALQALERPGNYAHEKCVRRERQKLKRKLAKR